MPDSASNRRETPDEVSSDLDEDLVFHSSIEQSYALGQSIIGTILNPPPDPQPVEKPPRLLSVYQSPIGMVIETEAGVRAVPIKTQDDAQRYHTMLDELVHPKLWAMHRGCC